MGEQRGLAPLLTVDLAPVTVELNLRESGARFPCKWSSVLEIYSLQAMSSFMLFSICASYCTLSSCREADCWEFESSQDVVAYPKETPSERMVFLFGIWQRAGLNSLRTPRRSPSCQPPPDNVRRAPRPRGSVRRPRHARRSRS